MSTKKNDARLAQQLDQSRQAMRKAFDGEPWVDVLIPVNRDEENADFQYVEAVVNGRVYLIQRGKTVNIPVPVYLVLAGGGNRFDVQLH